MHIIAAFPFFLRGNDCRTDLESDVETGFVNIVDFTISFANDDNRFIFNFPSCFGVIGESLFQ